jgi:hypothetical protein
MFKTTKIALACVLTTILTYLFISSIGYILSDDTSFRHCATHGGTIMFMLVLGWIPAVIVGADLDEYLSNK